MPTEKWRIRIISCFAEMLLTCEPLISFLSLSVSFPKVTFFEVGTSHPDRKAEEKIFEVTLGSHNTVSEFRTFAQHILDDTPVSTDVYEGAKTALACISIVESSESGKIINPDYTFS